MKITSVLARNVAVPLATPTRIATREIVTRNYLLITIQTDSGFEGLGYAYSGTLGGDTLVKSVQDIIAPLIVGEDAHDISRLWSRVYQEGLLAGRRGLLIRALSAVDIALWDAKAKEAGLPLASYLGGDVHRPVPAYASGGYYQQGDRDPVGSVTQEIELNREHGFTDHKIKVGGLSVAEDAARIGAAFEVIGDNGRLAIDANNAYRNVPEALTAIRAFERAAGDHQIWWYEEALSPDNFAGHADLVRRVDTPIATGEIHQTRWDFRQIIEQRAADILQLDVGVLGGITEYLKVAHAAETFDLPVAPHWHANVHAQLAAASTNTLVVEHFLLEKDIYNFERLLTEETRLRYADNQVFLSERPGIGIEFDEDVIAAFTKYAN
ncbi:mandelate racemase/muconate lactonizing enzyme family protein [Rhodococcus erythropolis]|uniref:mandelate racemase/muconate lactonizing enzyme family protein n=1 Tax=Rhodococcus erythropolis TaxID=1833 RepID=UPI001BEC7B40|nr:mandelate racemase/muconate lactonizing enzyme family protein [Rhodococcus erythropolis]MBT2266066.1 mandelate racemase/muconate lactonizing enzyme family protein [Rhodococcus erythropolis]